MRIYLHREGIFFITLFFTKVVSADDHAEQGVHPVKDLARGFHIGDNCVDSCSIVIKNSYCNNTSNTCLCLKSHPIVIEGVTCVEPRDLRNTCEYDLQCQWSDPNAACLKFREEDSSATCNCNAGYNPSHSKTHINQFICTPEDMGPLTHTNVPAIVGLGIGLTVLSLLLCFMFKLFNRNRWPRSRGYGDANLGPHLPTIVLEGERDPGNTEKHAPNQGPLSGNGMIKNGSIRSNRSRQSIKSSRSNNTQPSTSPKDANGVSQLEDDKNDPADGDYEQFITIMPNPKHKHRGSMADYAFPELHRSKQKEPENLLILTRTRTDRHGRRHSVAIPLAPPTEGDKLEGGYYLKRNLITGGTKLISPKDDKSVINRSASDRSRVPWKSQKSDRERRRLKVASLPTIGESKKSVKGISASSSPSSAEFNRISSGGTRRHSLQMSNNEESAMDLLEAPSEKKQRGHSPSRTKQRSKSTRHTNRPRTLAK